MGAIVAVVNKSGGNAAEYAVTMLKILSYADEKTFGLASPFALKIENAIEKLESSNINSSVIVGYVFSRITAADRPQPIKLKNVMLVFEGRTYPAPVENSDAEAFAKKVQNNPAGEAEKFIKEANGDFAFVIAEQERLIAGRDFIGARPLYFGENALLMALASERKALWKIGIEKVHPFPPGTLLVADKKCFNFLRVKMLAHKRINNVTAQRASEKLQALLQSSVKERVTGLKDVVVAFSGGLDSSLIAFLAKKAGANTHLIHVSLRNQPETAHAIKVAEELKLPLRVYIYTIDDVKKTLAKVLWLIEEPDPIKIGIGIPIYWAAEKTAKIGIKVLLAGQGADELFGGYKRYVTAYAKYGEKKVEEMLFNDVLNIYETNLERDCKICNFHGVELRLPFLTHEIVEFAANLPVKLKIKLPDDGMRKLVLRAVAKNLGLPKCILERPKRAIQYTTGVDKTLKKLAKQEKLSVEEYLMKNFQKALKKMMRND